MALADNLVAYWSLEEASGTRVDATGRGNDLTANNTPTNAAGKIGNALSLASASTQYLSRADNADLSMGNIDFTLAAWVNGTTITGGRGICGKWTGANNFEYLLWLNSTPRFEFFVTADGASGFPSAVSAQVPSTSTWYFVVAWHDSVNDKIRITVNDGTVASTNWSTGVFDGTAPFEIGRQNAGNYFNGLIDEVAVWKRVITAAEITDLYNAGNGRAYSYIVPSGGLLRQSMTGGMTDLRGGMRG